MPLSECVSLSLTLATVVLLAALQRIEACSCALQHPQSIFCQSEFVLKATVLSSSEVYDDSEYEGSGEVISYIRYQLHVIEPFKLHPDLELEETTSLYTASRMSSCSVRLEEGKTYVILGHMVDGMPFILPCGGFNEWGRLTSRMMRGYRFLYEQHCNCTVQVSFAPRDVMGDDLPDDRCFWFFREDPHFCYPTQGLCKQLDDQCKWSRTDAFKYCINQDDMGNNDQGDQDNNDTMQDVVTPEILDDQDDDEDDVITNDTLLPWDLK